MVSICNYGFYICSIYVNIYSCIFLYFYNWLLLTTIFLFYYVKIFKYHSQRLGSIIHCTLNETRYLDQQ